MLVNYEGNVYISTEDSPNCSLCVANHHPDLCRTLWVKGNSCQGIRWERLQVHPSNNSPIEYKVIPMEEDKSHVVPLEEQLPGTKYDDGKLDYTLIPAHALQELARNLTEGLKKYRERDNWKKVPEAQERYLKALYRHLEAHRRGEIYDTESSAPNMPHMAAVAVNAMFLLEFMLDPNLKDKQ